MYPKTVCLRQFTPCRRGQQACVIRGKRRYLCMHEPTISFSLHDDKEKEIKQTLTVIYDALRQKGYNPINQIVGYIMSGDPTYITSYKSARSLIMKVERDEILEELVKVYIETKLQ